MSQISALNPTVSTLYNIIILNFILFFPFLFFSTLIFSWFIKKIFFLLSFVMFQQTFVEQGDIETCKRRYKQNKSFWLQRKHRPDINAVPQRLGYICKGETTVLESWEKSMIEVSNGIYSFLQSWVCLPDIKNPKLDDHSWLHIVILMDVEKLLFWIPQWVMNLGET